MHELCVFALIFRLLLMKSTMMLTQCVHTLYHHMSELHYILIISLQLCCCVQIMLPVEFVPAHFTFFHAWYYTH